MLMNLSSLAGLFVFSVLLARTLGQETLGLYALFTATLMPFVYLVDLGQSTSLVQEINRAPDQTSRILKQTIVIKIVLTTGATAALLLVSTILFENGEAARLLWLFGLLILPRALYSTVEAVLRAHQKMALLAAVAALTAAGLILGSWLLFKTGQSFTTILAFLVALECCKAGLIWIAFRYMRPAWGRPQQPWLDVAACQNLARRSLPFFTVGIVGMLYYRLDVVLLGKLGTPAQVGAFSAAASFVKVLRMIPSVIVASFFPAISAGGKNIKTGNELTRRTLLLQVFANLTAAVVIFAVANELIRLTFAIDDATEILRIYVWSVVPLGIYSTLIYVFFHAGKSKWTIRVLSAALAINLGLNSILIPTAGASALAVSGLISETFCAICFAGLYLHFQRSRTSDVRERTTQLVTIE